jgi:hypothetical protein
MRSVRKEGHVPDWSALCSDSRISEKSRRILRSYEDRPARDKDKALSIKRGLERFRQLRGIATVGQHIYDSLEGEKVETDELLEDLRDSIASIQSRVDVKAEMHHTGKGNNSLKLVKDILYGKVKKFIPTGFKGFDEKNGGFLTGSLVVIAANSGGGKSALANQLAKNVAEHAMSDVCIIPLEMTAGQMWCRTFGILTGLDVHNIQQKKITRDERHLIIRKYTKWAKKLKKNETRHTVWAPEEDMGIEEMLYILKPFKYEMIIIDYIGLLKGADGDDQVKELGRIARFAKVYAKNTGTTVVLLAQLSDEGAVKYARAIKEHANNLWSWYCNEDESEISIYHIKQQKARNQSRHDFYLQCHNSSMAITDAEEGYFEGEEGDDKKSKGKKGKDKKRHKHRRWSARWNQLGAWRAFPQQIEKHPACLESQRVQTRQPAQRCRQP